MGVKASVLVELVEQAYREKWGYIWGQAGSLWTEAKQKTLTDKYNSNQSRYSDYKLGALYGSRWIGHRVADCSGLPYWALKQKGITIYHGSNSIWKNNLTHKGKIVKGMKLPVGAAIFTGNENSKDHIGTLVTATCVNEAKGTIAGVVHTPLSNKKWTYWGLYRGVDYDFIPGQEPAAPAQTVTQKPSSAPATSIPDSVTIPVTATVTLKTLRKGDKGDEVIYLQQLLMKYGEKLPRYGADGDFGNETLKAVKSYQTKNGLTVDGIVGPKTWKMLVTGNT